VVLVGFRGGLPDISRSSVWTYLFLATASHGFLDAMTDGGLGVAFLAPFDDHRYFLPWTPIRVSLIGLGRFFTSRGAAVIRSELLWIWVPVGALVVSVLLLRPRRPTRDAKVNES
jgi:inner membrane protein